MAVRWLAPSAPWAAAVGADPTSTSYVAGLALRGTLLYDDRLIEGGAHREEWEAVVTPLRSGFDPAAIHVVDHDDRDLLAAAPVGATYAAPELDLGSKSDLEARRRAVVDHLVASRPLQVVVNRELKLASRPGETPEAFALRCDAAADDAADKDAAELRRKYQARLRKEQDQVATAEGRVARAETSVNNNRSEELVEGTGSVLGAIFGGRKRARSIARSVTRAANRRQESAAAEDRLHDARRRVAEEQADVLTLEAELTDELTRLAARWDAAALAIEVVDVPLEKSDVSVSAACVLWLPVGDSGSG